MSTIDSTSDQRTANNTARHAYRTLSDAEKAQMAEVKDMGAALIAKLHEIGGTDPMGDRLASRDLFSGQHPHRGRRDARRAPHHRLTLR